MATATVSRKTIRDEIVSRLKTAITGGAGPYQSIFGHDKNDFKGESPVLLVLSRGSLRAQWGLGSFKYRTHFLFVLLSFVAEADASAGRTSLMVEDEIDATEKALADALLDNKLVAGFWTYMHFGEDEPSDIIPANIGGEQYKMEVMNLVVEVEDA